MELLATAKFGLEAVVARELRSLGFEQQRTQDGRVIYEADWLGACRSNLWLRSADRVMWKVAEFEARDFGELFDHTKAVPWPEILPPKSQFPVRGRSSWSQLHHVPSCQSIVKKAIVESLKSQQGGDWIEETGPEYAVEISIVHDKAFLAIDTSGPGLHKRGYRPAGGLSPIKETLAAGLIQLSFWNRERPLIDPFCGAGTLPIEAALIGRNIAPGLNRKFASEAWPQVSSSLWEQARSEARDLATKEITFPIIATDQDPQVLKHARLNAKAAGVEENIHFQQQEFRKLSSPKEFGCVVCNPPYGERSGNLSDVEQLYRDMARVFEPLDTWSFYILTSHPNFERLFGKKADKRRKLYNGRIACTYYQYYGPRPPRRDRGGEGEDGR
jgi:putative N6-adenine-specific DNA methylase